MADPLITFCCASFVVLAARRRRVAAYSDNPTAIATRHIPAHAAPVQQVNRHGSIVVHHPRPVQLRGNAVDFVMMTFRAHQHMAYHSVMAAIAPNQDQVPALIATPDSGNAAPGIADPLPQQAANRLRDLIITGDLPAAEKERRGAEGDNGTHTQENAGQANPEILRCFHGKTTRTISPKARTAFRLQPAKPVRRTTAKRQMRKPGRPRGRSAR